MSPLTLVLTALALSADAFAVSVSRGMRMPRFEWNRALLLAISCGVFQAAMPIVGWLLGSAFADAIEGFDHWIAFGLLAAIGAKLLWEAWKTRHEDDRGQPSPLTLREAIVLGIATSIDAMAAGVSFAFLDVNVWVAAAVIGVITFGVCLLGVRLGHRAGHLLAEWAEVVGGVILLAIGVKILVDHLAGGG